MRHGNVERMRCAFAHGLIAGGQRGLYGTEQLEGFCLAVSTRNCNTRADSVAGHFFSPAAHKALLLSGLRERKNVIGCIKRWGSVRCRVAVPV
jgi:hypothetical protein